MPNPYDTTAYPSHAIEQSFPKRLFTNSRFFGLNPTPLESARILEIGCASGGNIIPLAYRFPDACFVGFDYSSRQIEEGRKHITNLGLENINLNHESIQYVATQADTEKFDYILCHGVFSWVTEDLQEQIFSICTNNLKSGGVAYISYNVYPGWNAANTIRELMLWASRDAKNDAERAAKARAAITNMANGFDEKIFPYEYAADFKKRVTKILEEDDSYILHEHLEKENLPVYFYRFVERAQAKQLQYVTETDLSAISTISLPEPFASQLSQNPDIVDLGQHIDFIRNTQFRQSILCCTEQTLNRNILPEKVEQFHLQLEATPGNNNLSLDNISNVDHLELKIGDVTVNIDLKNAIICIALLYERRHQPISYQTLCEMMMTHSNLSDVEQVRHFLNVEMNLMSLVLAGVLSLHSNDNRYTTRVSAQPEACGFIRYQAKQGLNMVTTHKHKPMHVNPFDRLLLSNLDGHQNQNDLFGAVSKAIDCGTISLVEAEKNEHKNPAVTKQDQQQLVHEAIRSALQKYANEGCLIA